MTTTVSPEVLQKLWKLEPEWDVFVSDPEDLTPFDLAVQLARYNFGRDNWVEWAQKAVAERDELSALVASTLALHDAFDLLEVDPRKVWDQLAKDEWS